MLLPSRIRRRPLRHAFEEALDTALEGEEATVPGHDEAGPRVAPSASGLAELPEQSVYVGRGSLEALYEAEAGSRVKIEASDPWAAARRFEAEIDKAQSVAEVQRLRRRFAAQNHPDRVPLELRRAAQEVMAHINAKVDLALKAKKRS